MNPCTFGGTVVSPDFLVGAKLTWHNFVLLAPNDLMLFAPTFWVTLRKLFGIWHNFEHNLRCFGQLSRVIRTWYNFVFNNLEQLRAVVWSTFMLWPWHNCDLVLAWYRAEYLTLVCRLVLVWVVLIGTADCKYQEQGLLDWSDYWIRFGTADCLILGQVFRWGKWFCKFK